MSPPAPSNQEHLALQAILDAITDAVVVVLATGEVEQLNAEACRMLEISAEKARGKVLQDLLPASHPLPRLIEETRRLGHARVQDEIEFERRFGPNLIADVSTSPVLEEIGMYNSVVVTLRDRTTFKQLHEHASDQDKLISYGHIAAGIAHEVKNPLAGIRGTAELIGRKTQDSRTRRSSQLIVHEVDRISTLVEELMVFAKNESLSHEPVNVHRVLDDVIQLTESDVLAANVSFERIYDPSIPEIHADPHRLEQIFLNLSRNAIQAMAPNGGLLRVTTRMALESRLIGSAGRSDSAMEILIDDDGPGIDPTVLERLATPFFTTKESGTGLGLAVARHWANRHGGRLIIGESPNGGARIRVLLPLETAAAAADMKE